MWWLSFAGETHAVVDSVKTDQQVIFIWDTLEFDVQMNIYDLVLTTDPTVFNYYKKDKNVV